MRIAVDVDMTIVDTGNAWLEYLKTFAGRQILEPEDVLPYNLGELFPEIPSYDAMNFWNRFDLYDNLQPMAGATTVLQGLYDAGHEIVFVSHVIGNHYQSKEKFLERHFGFHSGFIATYQKQMVKTDVIIDDRIDHLNRCRLEGTNTILFDTPYAQNDVGDHVTIDKWGIESFFKILNSGLKR